MTLKKTFVVLSIVILTLSLSPSFSIARENDISESNPRMEDYYFEVPSIYTEISILDDGSID
ncbi:MAG: hypothetical protein KAU62_12985, partial [Candidatus Heimdallarchaeota archaeon]|nr:hypothetical protein [Candidatus Heimdallarchaeota archaeon]MCK4612067.1 hypothetical protein [Candidatus Heimdallarchaeota archaeon]